LTQSEIVLSGRGPFRLWSNTTISIGEIIHIERSVSWGIPWLAHQLRFRTNSPRNDRALFASTSRDIDVLERRLNRLGIPTVEKT
jgi:hypothetical protein